ncbi:MAG: Glycine--tRNA ligase beta subunit [Pelotomaculum thermopropionicum]|uniref:Glycine--tRNA ligase beta subunit n=1 Tax=Pelotomaculum thermopropionicum TaxID=110500 RepID=A0A101HSC9_9FIRM|nr:MAG: Glycine--tRNA ligase beta subunit [Pelotomaculum thermopropionicum]
MSAKVNLKDYLLEIGVEELPARFLDSALEELKELAAGVLREHRLSFERVATYGTPRRLVLYIKGLPGHQEPLEKEVKGPAAKVAYKPDGTPTRAAEGFAGSQGVPVAELVKKPLGHVDYVFAVKREAGRPARDILTEVAPGFITGLHFPKPMRWGELDVRFARPVRWILSLFGEEVIAFKFAGLKAGRITYGHRFLSKEPIKAASPAAYFEEMKKNYVLVDPRERKEVIRQQVQKLAEAAGGRVEEDEDLLQEVNNLVEYPTALLGGFSTDYLQLPREVLVTPMREHQRYFPVTGPDGGLLPKFIAVRNGTADHLDQVRAGNEKVLRARLADADFFYREDLKIPLAQKVVELKKIVFHERLGTVYDKVERMGVLAGYLADATGTGKHEKDQALRAAYLSKADLVTNMVYEFPELQGIMGKEYAARSGEEPAVAVAVLEHYLPRFAGDRLPETLPGKILSLADKIDNIAGFFAIDIQPSGSQDPYALRRQALGVCHVLLEGRIALSLEKMLEAAYRGYEGKVRLENSLEKVKADAAEFFRQRLKGIFSDYGFTYDVVDAVLDAGYDDFNDARLRAGALSDFRREPAFADLLTAFVRANNLSKNAVTRLVEPELLSDASEQKLYDHLSRVREETAAYLKQQDYRSFLAAVATLQKPLEEFFDSVMVMVEDEKVRENRLALLSGLVSLVMRVVDLRKIVVE